MTQRDRVLNLLRERGNRGLHSFEFYGDLNMPRGAAVICALKKEGYAVESVLDGKGSNGCTYYLRPSQLVAEQEQSEPEPQLVGAASAGTSPYDPHSDWA